jgi:hypothetical protein
VFVELREEGGGGLSERVLQFTNTRDAAVSLARRQAFDQSEVFRFADHFPHDDCFGTQFQLNASASAPAGFEVAESAEVLHHLDGMVSGNGKGLRNLGDGALFAFANADVKECPQRVVGELTQFHELIVVGVDGSFKLSFG